MIQIFVIIGIVVVVFSAIIIRKNADEEEIKAYQDFIKEKERNNK
jgi:NADH:ubiquinone oxidoreductase subunit 6 (subunit J)